MHSDIQRVLLDRHRIALRVEEVAKQIAADLTTDAPGSRGSIPSPVPIHRDNLGEGRVRASSPTSACRCTSAPRISSGGLREITLVPILTGSIIFVADLIRHLPLRMKIRLVSISSYPGESTRSKGAQVQNTLTNLPDSFAGAHVLLIDDILDSGGTLRLATDLIRPRLPASLRTCVLLRKQRPEAMNCPVDYVCFDIPDDFVVGYGLDFNDYYRNLPDIVTLRPEVTGL